MTPDPRAFVALLGLVLLAPGCATERPQQQVTAAERTACARHADTVFQMRNPDEVYRQDTFDTSTRDAPFAGAGHPGDTTTGLSSLYARSQLYDNCLNGGGGTVGAAPEAPQPTEAPPTRSEP